MRAVRVKNVRARLSLSRVRAGQRRRLTTLLVAAAVCVWKN